MANRCCHTVFVNPENPGLLQWEFHPGHCKHSHPHHGSECLSNLPSRAWLKTSTRLFSSIAAKCLRVCRFFSRVVQLLLFRVLRTLNRAFCPINSRPVLLWKNAPEMPQCYPCFRSGSTIFCSNAVSNTVCNQCIHSCAWERCISNSSPATSKVG